MLAPERQQRRPELELSPPPQLKSTFVFDELEYLRSPPPASAT